jgi:hypothetical protein
MEEGASGLHFGCFSIRIVLRNRPKRGGEAVGYILVVFQLEAY